jgi:hypothetical protein
MIGKAEKMKSTTKAALAGLGAAALALAGCSTPYQKMGPLGGVKSVQIASDMAQVTARGSVGTDPDRIERYVLRKAAETTLAAGYDHFWVVSVGDRSRTIQGFAGYTAAAFQGLPSAGFSLPFVRPGETILIRMSRGANPQPGATMFDAPDVLSYLAERGRG